MLEAFTVVPLYHTFNFRAAVGDRKSTQWAAAVCRAADGYLCSADSWAGAGR